MVLIIISSINLALDNPLLDPEGWQTKTIRYIDIVLTSIFVIEVALKVIAFGLLFNGPKSYLRSVWNLLDLVIIALSVSYIHVYNFADCFYNYQLKRFVCVQGIEAGEGLETS